MTPYRNKPTLEGLIWLGGILWLVFLGSVIYHVLTKQ
jgi:hypothetical protein